MMNMATVALKTPVVWSAHHRPQQQQRISSVLNPKSSNPKSRIEKKAGFGGQRKEPQWQCVQGCGACCKLDKGPAFPAPEEIFAEITDVELYRSLIGPDGWCIHYDKTTRTCSIYPDRPYFCRVEPEIFDTLYGIDKKKFNKEACSSCRDTIKAIYGSNSQELANFNQTLRKQSANSSS